MEASPRNRAQQSDRDGTGAAPPPEGDRAVHDTHQPPHDRSDAPDDGIADGHPATLDASDGPDAEPAPAPEGGESFRDLRPPRRLRWWQLAPIVALAALGSLMFAFPLAFELGGDGGAVIAMLGLLLCCCAAGTGMMAARRVGHTWPGLPVRGSGRRANWRVVLLYATVVAVLAALAIWRVARLR
ncbi:hypothetical protein ACFC0M_29640 [Streptomyces sp. NPDC056149]|uniref:hypothetical protein n=1 Tax=unclassified Streptomyces TaxID=2593676 RepID=UPI002380F84D|nr:hypothetical protein [Streptomyces sp. WZ-12]